MGKDVGRSGESAFQLLCFANARKSYKPVSSQGVDVNGYDYLVEETAEAQLDSPPSGLFVVQVKATDNPRCNFAVSLSALMKIVNRPEPAFVIFFNIVIAKTSRIRCFFIGPEIIDLVCKRYRGMTDLSRLNKATLLLPDELSADFTNFDSDRTDLQEVLEEATSRFCFPPNIDKLSYVQASMSGVRLTRGPSNSELDVPLAHSLALFAGNINVVTTGGQIAEPGKARIRLPDGRMSISLVSQEFSVFLDHLEGYEENGTIILVNRFLRIDLKGTLGHELRVSGPSLYFKEAESLSDAIVAFKIMKIVSSDHWKLIGYPLDPERRFVSEFPPVTTTQEVDDRVLAFLEDVARAADFQIGTRNIPSPLPHLFRDEADNISINDLFLGSARRIPTDQVSVNDHLIGRLKLAMGQAFFIGAYKMRVSDVIHYRDKTSRIFLEPAVLLDSFASFDTEEINQFARYYTPDNGIVVDALDVGSDPG